MNWMMYPSFVNAVRALKAKGVDNETITSVLSEIHSAVVQAAQHHAARFATEPAGVVPFLERGDGRGGAGHT
jgi:hypothetical protein